MTKNYHTVIVILDAIPEKEDELLFALQEVAELSRAETYCIEYRLHRNQENSSQFVLYETWESKEKHAEQFTKPYIVRLGQQLETLLAKPYVALFANEI